MGVITFNFTGYMAVLDSFTHFRLKFLANILVVMNARFLSIKFFDVLLIGLLIQLKLSADTNVKMK